MSAAAEPGTVEAWALAFLATDRLEEKLAPPRPPARWAATRPPEPPARPGRPAGLEVATNTRRSVRRGTLRHLPRRARLVHTFAHHELQAAELMAWALLAFADAEPAFRRGLLGICTDELRHLGMYRHWLEEHGYRFGSFPVRDWFWERVPRCRTPVQFVALMGMGLEGGNLDHTERHAGWFREVGDAAAARLTEQVGAEEIAHVRFALHWFRHWTGGIDYDRFRAELVPPLTPRMLQGRPLAQRARRAAGFEDGFLDRLRAE